MVDVVLADNTFDVPGLDVLSARATKARRSVSVVNATLVEFDFSDQLLFPGVLASVQYVRSLSLSLSLSLSRALSLSLSLSLSLALSLARALSLSTPPPPPSAPTTATTRYPRTLTRPARVACQQCTAMCMRRVAVVF
jgi:hypothetical protein